MVILQQKEIVKMIFPYWKTERLRLNDGAETSKTLSKMGELSFRHALYSCGLTLNEIIALGDAEDLEVAIDELFDNVQPVYSNYTKQ